MTSQFLTQFSADIIANNVMIHDYESLEINEKRFEKNLEK